MNHEILTGLFFLAASAARSSADSSGDNKRWLKAANMAPSAEIYITRPNHTSLSGIVEFHHYKGTEEFMEEMQDVMSGVKSGATLRIFCHR